MSKALITKYNFKFSTSIVAFPHSITGVVGRLSGSANMAALWHRATRSVSYPLYRYVEMTLAAILWSHWLSATKRSVLEPPNTRH